MHELKDRSQGKPFIILIADTKMLDSLSINQESALPAKPYWPGPLTLIVGAPKAPDWLRLGLDTLAVRMPDDKKLLELIRRTGPLISTSANPEGEVPAKNAEEGLEYFGDKLDFYVDAGSLTGQASTIASVNNGKLQVIRQGAVNIKEES